MLTVQNILYVYSDAANNRIALRKAVALAKNNNAQLTVLFTISEQSFPDDLGLTQDEITKYYDELEEKRSAILTELSSSISIRHESIHNDSHLEVIKKVKQHNYDLLIKPSKNEGLIGKLLGRNDIGYLRQCPCSVLLIDDESKHKEPSHCIIAAVDVDESYPENELSVRAKLNTDVITAAALFAVANGCCLKVVSIWSAQYEKTLRHAAFVKKNTKDVDAYVTDIELSHVKKLNTFMDGVQKTLGDELFSVIKPESISIKGNPKEAIAEYAKNINADLVVMGTVARVGIPGLIIGNTAENILYRLNQSLLAIKPEGFKSLVD